MIELDKTVAVFPKNKFQEIRVGVREFKENMSVFLKKRGLLIVTEHGEPTRVVVPYAEMLEMVDLIEELNDPQTLALVAQGRRAIRSGAKGIPIFSNGKSKSLL